MHRGWSVLPKQKRRTRMQVDGCAWVVAPSAEEGKVDVTIGSALDIFGGDLPWADIVAWQKAQDAEHV